MTTDEKTTQNSDKRGSTFNCCEEMMKMMGRCTEGKGDKKDFEQFCTKMSTMCREMMNKMEGKTKEKGE